MICSGAAGCGGDEEGKDGGTDSGVDSGVTPSRDGGTADVGTSPDASTPNPCDTAMPILGGGQKGGAINGGQLIVFTLDDATREPIADLHVVVTQGTERLDGRTDARGCVAFTSSAMTGPVDVHVFSPDRTPFSHLSITNAEVTLLVEAPDGAGPLLASVTGTVTNLEVTTATSSMVAQVAIVDPIPSSPFDFLPEQPPRPNNVGQNIAVVGGFQNFDMRDFTVLVPAFGAKGLLVTGGSFTTPRFGQGQFTRTHLGFVTDLTFSAGVEIMRDVELTHTLGESIGVVFPAAPADVTVVRAWPFIELAGGGQALIGFQDNATSGVMFDVPALDRVLAGAKYGAIVLFGNADGSQISFRIERAGASSTIMVPNPIPPASAVTTNGRTVTATFDPGADFAVLTLVQGDRAVWRAVHYGTGTQRSFVLPAPPADVSDPLSGDLLAVVGSFGFDDARFDRRNFVSSELNAALEARAFSNTPVVFEAERPPNPYACDPMSAPPPDFAGGWAGGAITGELHVRVALDNQVLVRRAPVIVETSTGGIYSAETDDIGCVRIRRPGLAGPVSVHAFPVGRAYVTLTGLRAKNVTLVTGSAQAPLFPTATITGEVSGFEVLSATTAMSSKVAIVETIRGDLFGPDAQQRVRNLFGVLQTSNVVGIAPDGTSTTSYELLANAENTLGVLVRGGTTGDRGVSLTHFGLGPRFTPIGGEARKESVRLTTAQDRPIRVTLPASTLTQRLALGYMRLAPEGVMIMGASEVTTATTVAFDAPPASGDLAGATYAAAVQETGPSSFALVIEEGSASPDRAPTLPPLPGAATAVGRRIALPLPPGLSDMGGFQLRRAQGAALWTVTILEPGASPSATLPVPPARSSDPLVGALDVDVSGFDLAPGTDVQTLPGRALLRSIRSIARNTTTLTF
jgi:hypothetical protein